jgi:hypothetical protein
VMLEAAYSDKPLHVEDRQCILAVAKLTHIVNTTARKGQYGTYCLLFICYSMVTTAVWSYIEQW